MPTAGEATWLSGTHINLSSSQNYPNKLFSHSIRNQFGSVNMWGDPIFLCLLLSVCWLSGIHTSDKNPVYGRREEAPLWGQIKKECKWSSLNTVAFWSHSCLLFCGYMPRLVLLEGKDQTILTLLGSKVSGWGHLLDPDQKGTPVAVT